MRFGGRRETALWIGAVRIWISLTLVGSLLAACTSTPSDLREWRAADHDQADEPGPGQAAPGATAPGGIAGAAKMLGVDQVVLVTWRQSCARCHGTLGRGDGPEGAMSGARNLSDPAWQKATDDQQIAASIKNGKGRMPAFALPDSTIAGLVKVVRMMNADAPPPFARGAAPATSADAPASAAPPGSAAPRGAAPAHRGKSR